MAIQGEKSQEKSVVEINTLLSMSINTKPSNLTDLASMVCEIIIPAELARVVRFGFYNLHPRLHQIYVFRAQIHSSIEVKGMLFLVTNSLNFLDEVDQIPPYCKTASDQPFLRRLLPMAAALTFLIPDTAVKLVPASME